MEKLTDTNTINHRIISCTPDYYIYQDTITNKTYVMDKVNKEGVEVVIAATVTLSDNHKILGISSEMMANLFTNVKWDYAKLSDDGKVFYLMREVHRQPHYNPHKNVCPFCGSTDWYDSNYINCQGIECGASIHRHCNNCNKGWTVWFKLVPDGASFDDGGLDYSYMYSQEECENLE